MSYPLATRFLALALVLVCAFVVPARAEPDGGDYKLGADDLVKVTVFDHPELSVDARVTKSGNITFPLLGELHVAGLTTRDCEQLLVKKLDDGGYVHRAQAAVLITEYQSQKVSVMGQVARPGQYALTTTSKVMDALALAGGPVNAVAADQATLVRQNGTKVVIDLQKLFDGDPGQNPGVAAGDTLYVPRAPSFYIYGEVQRPGAYRLERNMTVAQAISAGGGLTPKGSSHWMKVKRVDGSGVMHEVSIKEHDLLRSDDVLMIKQSWF
jgi:polysaccharide biosynthesis/export protein